MEMIKTEDVSWDELFLEHDYIIVNYHSSAQGTVFDDFNKTFLSLSKKNEYEKVKFLLIDSKNNPIAEEFIQMRKLPFVATFKKGFLVECNTIETEENVRDMLNTLFNFELKL